MQLNQTHCGDNRELLDKIPDDSIDLSVWSPPYSVGKSYEAGISHKEWSESLATVIRKHMRILKPGGFMAVNIADILAFPDENMPRFQADLATRKRSPVTKLDVLEVMAQNPDHNRHQIAATLGCSEQTVQRRLDNNNVRGGKAQPQTRVKPVMGIINDMALDAGLYMYDRRVWVKDPAWQNSQWHAGSYRAVDEFEYVLIFWKPGITSINRGRLSRQEWVDWGSRGVWRIPSVRRNDTHVAMFPVELPTRIIRLLTEPGAVVLDPYMGSGTTAVAALSTGRQYLGIEMDEIYCAMANTRARGITPDQMAIA